MNRRVLLVGIAWTLGCGSMSPPPAFYSGHIQDQRDSFLVCGDIQDKLWYEIWREDTNDQRRRTLDRLAQEDPAFLLQLGDLVGKGACGSQWTQLDRDLHRIQAKDIAIFPALGNHEYFGDAEKALNHYFTRFPHLKGRRWYEFRYRGLLFLVVDSNEGDLSSEDRRAQREWYAAALTSGQKDADVRAIVVASHHPPYTNAHRIPPSTFMRDHFVEPARRNGKVKLFLSGHVHSYERFEIEGIHFVVSGGGGAPQNFNGVAGPSGRYGDLYDGPRRFHFLRMHLGESLRAEVVMMDHQGHWKSVDEFVVPLSTRTK